MAKYLTVTEPTIGENTYIIFNQFKQALIVDPGAPLMRIQQTLVAEGLTPVAVLLTHGHYDHIVQVDAVVNQYEIPVYIHKKDANCFQNPKANLGTITLETKPDLFKGSEGQVELANFVIHFWHSPGHSPGSTVLSIDQDQVLITGDVLFSGSVGRFDFPTSNEQHHQASLKRIFATFSDQVKVLPGHGMATTIWQERMHNPFKSWF
ncbi:MAG: MBL fold metallo-hydrolase [Culicoidibacterales bacterium]